MRTFECKASWAAAVAVVATAVAPQAVAAAPVDVLRDCADDSSLSRDYSRAELQGALREMPGDLDEYSNCRAVIGAALAAAGSPSSPPGDGSPAPSGGDDDEAAPDPVGGVASRNEGRGGGGKRAPDASRERERADGANGPAGAAERAPRERDPAGRRRSSDGDDGGASGIPGTTSFLNAARAVRDAPPALLLLAAVGCLAVLGAAVERRRA